MVEAVDSNGTLRTPISGITGNLTFLTDGRSVRILGNVSNVPFGVHGVSIHTNPFSMVSVNGITGGRCRQSGPLYNPHNVSIEKSDELVVLRLCSKSQISNKSSFHTAH